MPSEQSPTTQPAANKTHCLNTLIFDVLRLVITEVSYESVKELAGLCLISRRLYLCTVPYLYRYITFDMTRASHLRLLQRLLKPGSRLAEKIHWLTISGTEKSGAVRLLDL